MKIKDYSRLGKMILMIIGFVLSILKWINVLPNATITEIWQVIAFAYAVVFGTIDWNICADNIMEKVGLKNER
jgi:hypothetical protein